MEREPSSRSFPFPLAESQSKPLLEDPEEIERGERGKGYVSTQSLRCSRGQQERRDTKEKEDIDVFATTCTVSRYDLS